MYNPIYFQLQLINGHNCDDLMGIGIDVVNSINTNAGNVQCFNLSEYPTISEE